MPGIDSLVGNRADLFANNPQGLQQRYAQSQDLLDLLALQKLKTDKEAAARNIQMQMQAPPGTVKDQREQQLLDMTKREIAQQVAPGLAMQGQRMAAAQPPQQARPTPTGVAALPAPNMSPQMMAGGGIVAFADGGMPPQPQAESQMDIDIRMYQAAERVANDPNATPEARRRAQMEMQRIKAQGDPAKLFQEIDRRRGDYPGLARGGVVGYQAGGDVDYLREALQAEGIDDQALIDFITALRAKESSSGRDRRTSPSGARGPMQVMPRTFQEMADEGWDINDPLAATRAGIRYAKKGWDVAGGDPRLAAAHYYGGPGGYSALAMGGDRTDPNNPEFPSVAQYAEDIVSRMPTQYPRLAQSDVPQVGSRNRGPQSTRPPVVRTREDQARGEPKTPLGRWWEGLGAVMAASDPVIGAREVESRVEKGLTPEQIANRRGRLADWRRAELMSGITGLFQPQTAEEYAASGERRREARDALRGREFQLPPYGTATRSTSPAPAPASAPYTDEQRAADLKQYEELMGGGLGALQKEPPPPPPERKREIDWDLLAAGLANMGGRAKGRVAGSFTQGVMGEKQRREEAQLERDKLAATEYGAELDYRAAIQKLAADQGISASQISDKAGAYRQLFTDNGLRQQIAQQVQQEKRYSDADMRSQVVLDEIERRFNKAVDTAVYNDLAVTYKYSYGDSGGESTPDMLAADAIIEGV